MVITNDLKVIKSINNNVLLVKDKGVEKILFEKGIGFGKKIGDIIEAGTKIDKITIHHMAGNLSVETCGNVFKASIASFLKSGCF